MTKKNKLELIAITPEMSKEEIRQNLLKVLKKQGIEVKENTNEKKYQNVNSSVNSTVTKPL